MGGDSRVELARSRIALAIRSDALKPDLRTIDSLKQTLLAAGSIAYATEGAGGLFFAELVRKLGLAEPLASKGRPLTTGVDVGAAVARGDAEFGVLPLSEVLPVRGIEAIENFPAELQGYVTMVAGLRAGASPSDGARALVAFLTDTGALPVIEKRGMERPR